MKLDNSWRNTVVFETGPRSDIAEGKLVAGRNNSAPSTKRKYVWKPINISNELYWKILWKKDIKVLNNNEEGVIAFKLEKVWCPWWTNPNKDSKRIGVYTERTIGDYLNWKLFNLRRTKMDGRFY